MVFFIENENQLKVRITKPSSRAQLENFANHIRSIL